MRKRLALVVLILVAGGSAVWGPRAIAFLGIGTTYAAQQTCACIHLGGRTLESCTHELGKAGSLLHVESEGDVVRATALLGLFSGEARNEDPYGCHPVK